MNERTRQRIVIAVVGLAAGLLVAPFSDGGAALRADAAAKPTAAPPKPRPQEAQPQVDADAKFGLDFKAERLVITHAGGALAEFVFRDPKILRPFFANFHGPRGTKITRNHPPIPGKDAADHDTMHPGIWFGFGDISGSDFWRNQGNIKHVRFLGPPRATREQVEFATECRLETVDKKLLAVVVHRIALRARPSCWLLIWDATFHSDDRDFTFGDQEEMGFGARMATRFTEKNGGMIRNSHGQKSAKGTWGKAAAWCDYSGVKDGQSIGITLMASPKNFRESWWHNRDYGVFVANPFGRAAMRQGAASAVTVQKGESLRLVFGAAIHDSADYDPASEYQFFRESVR